MPIVNGISRRVSDPRTLRVQRILRIAGTRYGLEVLKYLARHQEFIYPDLRAATQIPQGVCWNLISKFLTQGLLIRSHRPYRLRSPDPRYVYHLSRDGYVVVQCVAKLCASCRADAVGEEE